MSVLILDLDGTLVDSSALEDLRLARKWKQCIAEFGRTKLYENLPETLTELRKNGVRLCVVTNSVSFYASNLLRHHGIQADALVCYHDTREHKPSREPVDLALRQLGVPADAVLAGIGDHANDAAAYRAAGLRAVGAGWSAELDGRAGWDFVLVDPRELLKLGV